MFLRPTRTVPDTDPLLTADLPERVQTGRDRLAYQHDPALRDALSEQELQAERQLAERVREHRRTEQLAELTTAEATAAEVRKTTTEIVRTEARDLTLARRALAEQRRASSPHAQLAQLYRIKKWSGRALAGVVAGAMAFSAANVQHNLAPGGPNEPLYWMSYLLEALISTVLVVFMVSGSAVARWKVVEGEKTIQRIEVALLGGSILLNTYPYLRAPQDWAAVAVHSVAPIMMGVALFGHTAVAKRMGAAITKASLEVSATDDTAERLAELLTRARTTTAVPERGIEPRDDAAAQEDFAHEFTDLASRAEGTAAHESRARERLAAHATQTARGSARDDVDRAPLARYESELPRAEYAEPRATQGTSSIARDIDTPRGNPPADPEGIARDDRAPRAAHSPDELGNDGEPIAEREDNEEPSARDDSEAVARDLTPLMALVRAPQASRATRETTRPSRAHRAPIARATAVDGALARAADRAPRATPIAHEERGSGPFAREMTPAEATRLARAVGERGKSKQPIEVLAQIYRAKSQGMTTNFIGDTIVHLPHSTVGRAISAAIAVSGPHALD
ncbi:hypothetical protein ACFYTS_35500 [Nocardia sp. NPDC004151]|uniref:hypothetical protein n=1 Tax=Nocardia sp. NPDC004151 TaxID=3364304 RepID=UPI0036AE7A68